VRWLLSGVWVNKTYKILRWLSALVVPSMKLEIVAYAMVDTT
jgi:hypothetical protein